MRPRLESCGTLTHMRAATVEHYLFFRHRSDTAEGCGGRTFQSEPTVTEPAGDAAVNAVEIGIAAANVKALIGEIRADLPRIAILSTDFARCRSGCRSGIGSDGGRGVVLGGCYTNKHERRRK